MTNNKGGVLLEYLHVNLIIYFHGCPRFFFGVYISRNKKTKATKTRSRYTTSNKGPIAYIFAKSSFFNVWDFLLAADSNYFIL